MVSIKIIKIPAVNTVGEIAGYNFYMDGDEIVKNLDSKNYVYILAPQYNKSFAKFSKARKMISFRTVFNITCA